MIDKTAIIDSKAKLSTNVKIGPYCVIGPNVEIGENTIIHSHVNISGNTKIGKSNKIYPFVSINDPQDLKYNGEPTNLVIGDNNKIREYVTINPGTVGGGGKTVIGNNCLFMISSHIAHDCQIGNNIVFSNNTTLAGHVIVGDYVILGGFTGIHQFCHLGEGCFSAISSIITKDIPPYITVKGNPATPRCINKIGLQRRGHSQEEMNSLRKCFRILYLQSNPLEKAIQKIDSEIDKHKVVQKFRDFVTESDRGIAR